MKSVGAIRDQFGEEKGLASITEMERKQKERDR